MTRRDRCFKCDELVCGGEVRCDYCGESFCDGCVDTYDPLSRIAKIIAFIDNNGSDYIRTYKYIPPELYYDFNSKPLLTDDEIDQFIQDLHSLELQKYLNEEYPIHYENDLKDYNIEVRERFHAERHRIVELYETKVFNFHLQLSLIEFINDMIALDDPVTFICKSCMYPEQTFCNKCNTIV